VIKFIIMGLWVLLVTLGALFVGNTMTGAMTGGMSDIEPLDGEIAQEKKRAQTKTDMINIPVMVEGEVTGYLLVELVFVSDEDVKSGIDLDITPFVNDAVFTEFFGAYTDKHQIEKVRFEPSRERIIDNVNQRFGRPVIKDILMQQFNFVTMDKIREQQNRAE